MRFQMSARWLRIIALALVSIVAAGCGTGDGEESIDASAEDPSSSGFKLIFEDDFGGPATRSTAKASAKGPMLPLPVGNWRVDEGYGPNNAGWGNDEWQEYRNSIDNVFIQDNSLVIRAKCENTDPLDDVNIAACNKRDLPGPNSNNLISSGKIISKERLNVKFGKIQARIKMPSGKGMWPAFWTLGSDIDSRPWPDAGEIDIVEMHYFYSDVFTTHFATHWSGPRYTSSTRPVCASGVGSSLDPNEEENCKTETKTFDTPLTDDFHIFEVVWNENLITGKIDGITYFTQAIDPATMEEFLKDHYLILNVAVGGTLGSPIGPRMTGKEWADPDKTDMLVDWVRVYEFVPPSESTLIAENGRNLPYNRIINSAEFDGAFVESDTNSTAVKPLVGSKVLELNYSTSRSENGGVPAFFSGAIFDFNNIDLSSYSSIVFSIDTSAFPGFKDIAVEFQGSFYDPANGIFSDVQARRTGPKYLVKTSGTWRTYRIPLRDFPLVNLSQVAAIGFFNPHDEFGNLIAGTLYIDDIRFKRETCAPGKVLFADQVYGSGDASGAVIVIDPCRENSLTTVRVQTTDDNFIVVPVYVFFSGQSPGFFNFGPMTDDAKTTISTMNVDTLKAIYIDANGNTQEAFASVNPSPPMDDRAYIYATDPTIEIDLWLGVDYNIDNFGSGSDYDFFDSFSDPDFKPVLAIDSGFGYFVDLGLLAFTDFDAGFSQNYDTLNFKVKGIPPVAGATDPEIEVKFFEEGVTDSGAFYNLNTTPESTPIGNGWYEVTIPLAGLPNRDTYNGFLFATKVLPGPATFFLTDIYLGFGFAGPPATAATTPTQDPANVISIFSDAYTDIPGTNYNPNWGQSTVFSIEQIAGNDTLKFAGLDYQGIELGTAQDLTAAGMDTLHLDFWTGDSTALDVFLISPGPGAETAYTLPVTRGTWVSVDIPLSAFTAVDLANVFQMKFEGNGTVYIDNIYFYDSTGGAGGPATIDVYNDTYVDQWDGWVCCGPSAAVSEEVAADSYFGNVFQVDYTGNNNIAGLTYGPEPDRSIVLDASAFANGGTLEFDALVTRAGSGEWKIKIEGDNPGMFAEVPLSASNEGVAPVEGVWQHYTFDIAGTLSGQTMDWSKVKLLLFFSDFAAGLGAIQIDNVEFKKAPVAVFNDTYVDQWDGWVCCGPSAAVSEEVAANSYFGNVFQVDYTGNNNIAGLTYGPEPDRSIVLDASAFANGGTLEFDALVTRAGSGEWKIKIEGDNPGMFAEVPLSASNEGVAPVEGVWQHYSFDIAGTLSSQTMDWSKVKLLLFFSDFAAGLGAIQIDNVEFRK